MERPHRRLDALLARSSRSPGERTAGAMPTCSRSLVEYDDLVVPGVCDHGGEIRTVAGGDRRAHRVGRLGAEVTPGRDRDQWQALDGFRSRAAWCAAHFGERRR